MQFYLFCANNEGTGMYADSTTKTKTKTKTKTIEKVESTEK